MSEEKSEAGAENYSFAMTSIKPEKSGKKRGRGRPKLSSSSMKQRIAMIASSASPEEGEVKVEKGDQSKSQRKAVKAGRHVYPIADGVFAVDGGPGVVLVDNGTSLTMVHGYRILPRGDGYYFLGKMSTQTQPSTAAPKVIKPVKKV